MTERTLPGFDFPAVGGRRVEAHFDGGHVTSDGGCMLLRQTDRRLGLTRRAALLLKDPRQRGKVKHPMVSMLRQRLFGLALGYEDLNDHDLMRHDLCLQSAVDRTEVLASSSTLCRLENGVDRQAAVGLNKLMVELFIESFTESPSELVLDFDATDVPVHGDQVGRFFHGFYDNYCFLPLYVTCGSQLLVSYLRASNKDGARHAWAILALLVRRFRQVWPDVRIIFRADSGFCRHRLLEWCDRNNVGYVVGLARNRRLESMCSRTRAKAQQAHRRGTEKVRRFIDIGYAASTWKRRRRVIVKAEYNRLGANTRFVVTNLPGEGKQLYDQLYCARGDMENRIKEQQLDLFADRTSCHNWWPNQFRILLSSLAYVLLEAMRRLALKGTELACAQCSTIRLKLLKIGAVVTRNTRRVRLMLSSACPWQALFLLVARRLALE